MTKGEGISLEKSKPALAVVCTCSAVREGHRKGERASE